ncbi:huntingtin-like [Ornithodoros turicata]|uniref:huntingtin-like n=1 Tax=Ornithodoros turicata TaxID=34597 RepID=UPI003138D400
MASIEKLIKSLEALKLVEPSVGANEQQVLKRKDATRKDKILHCSNIADAICTPSIRSFPDFPKLLGVSIESFFTCCDDDDSDVRMVADECLNRTIKTLLDSHLGRLQAELYKEIKKNDQGRSLRVALTKFGDLCHLIKVQKCRPYTVNLLPCFVRISERTNEESVQEALTNTIVKMMPVVGQFTSDNDIKMLMRAFLRNLSCPSALVRRSAALALVTVCQWSRKPNVFFLSLLQELFGLVLPVQETRSIHVIIGVLVCLRQLVPHLGSRDKTIPTLEEILKVYELLLHHVTNQDHAIVTAALEALQQLLQVPSLVQVLLCPEGVTQSLIHNPVARADTLGLGSSLNLEDEVDLADDSEDPKIGSLPSYGSSEQLLDTDEGTTSEDPDIVSLISCDGDDFSSSARLVVLDSPIRRPSSLRKLELKSDQEWNGEKVSICSSPACKLEFVFGNTGSYVDADIPIKYCARLLASSFLLTGTPGVLIPDRNVRVSLKVLAVGCLTRCLLLYPPALFLDLHVHQVPDQDGVQKLWDVLELINHSDPLLCGQTALMIGHYLGYTLKLASPSWNYWARKQSPRPDVPKLADLVAHIEGVVRSSSSVASRTGIQAVRLCLTSMLRSCHATLVPLLLQACIDSKDSSYWLLKVEMAEMIGELPFRSLEHISHISRKVIQTVHPRAATYQEILVFEILVDLLGDEDSRVRMAAATQLVKCVPQLYFAKDGVDETVVAAEAEAETMQLLGWLFHENTSAHPQVHGLVKPFNCKLPREYSPYMEGSLSRVIARLWSKLHVSANRYEQHGCCQALACLIVDYPATIYSFAWGCVLDSSLHAIAGGVATPLESAGGLLAFLVALLTASPLALDIHAHQHLLVLSGHLVAGACFKCIQPKEGDPGQEEAWPCVKDRNLVPLLDKLFQHTMRLLNVFAHTLDEQGTPSRGSVGSPIRRRNKGRDDTLSSTVKAAPTKMAPDTERPSQSKSQISNFASLPHYLRLHDVLRAAHSTYKVSLDSSSCEKFSGLLKAALETVGQILEVAQLQDVNRCVEELLSFLKLSIGVEPQATVQCVRQLLKALFGTNLASLWEATSVNDVVSSSASTGLYYNCCSYPYTSLTKLLASYASRPPLLTADPTMLGSWITWARRGCEKKLSGLLKPGCGSKSGKAVLAAHIRLFEPVVLQALKLYTVSSSASLQAAVLDLLAQLVHLRVNYCLLDSDQVFIGFVIKQFEFIEEGQITNAEVLVPQIFYFLVLLSYERYHSKPIISMPEIIQLCDRLMASGQPPIKYVIPALQAIVEDLFLLPNTNRSDSRKELETQREVVISILLKLVQYPEVPELLLAVVYHSYQEGEDRWKKFSRQLIDVILPLLSRMQVFLDKRHALDILQRLFDSVSPSVFRPVDILLKALFIQPASPDLEFRAERWMCLVLLSLRVLLAQSKEEVVLSRLADLALPLRVPCQLAPETHQLDAFGENIEKALAMYLIEVVNAYAKYLCDLLFQCPQAGPEDVFPFQQMSSLLLYLTHMFQSGSFRCVATAAMEAVKSSCDAINEHFLHLAYLYPTLTVQWCNVLTLLNYGEQQFWSRVLWPGTLGSGSIMQKNLNSPSYSCSFELVSQAGLILLCDYLCENVHDAEPMTWLIVNHVTQVIRLSAEPPVSDFISGIHRNFAASGLFIQAILSRCEPPKSPSLVSRLLCCLEGIHPAQSCALLCLLVEKVLPTAHCSLARSCEALAQRQLELMLSASDALDANLEDLAGLPATMQSLELDRRHPHLFSLLEKVLKTSQGFIQERDSSSKMTICKEWYLAQVRQQCCSPQAVPEKCAQLLASLNYEDALAVLQLKEISPCVLCASLNAQKWASIESPLYRASRAMVLSDVGHVVAALPQPHHPFLCGGGEGPHIVCHSMRLSTLFGDATFWMSFVRLVPPTVAYLNSLRTEPADVPVDSLEDIARFSILCAEAIRWMVDKPGRFSCDQLKQFLNALDVCLSHSSISLLIGLQKHATWVCSAVSAIHSLAVQLKGWCSFPVEVVRKIKPKDNSPEYLHVQQSCVQVTQLVGWLEHGIETHIPSFIKEPLQRVITGLARLPLVNSFVRIPPILWHMDWMPHMSGEWHTFVPPPPADLLFDRELLQEYIYRVNLLGWVSRQQFEETWMALLGVLNTSPSSEHETAQEERVAVQCLAVRCITSLLLQSLRLPQPGNPHSSTLLHQPRDKPHTRYGKQLQAIRAPVDNMLLKLLRLPDGSWGNLEKLYRPSDYSLGQVSVEYLCIAVGLADSPASPDSSSSSSSSDGLQREASLAAAGLDLRSCLHLLHDLYTQWLAPPDTIGQPLLTETIRSVVMLSDIFMESTQFDWMVALFMDIYRHQPIEDQVLMQYLILGITKATSVVGLDTDTVDKAKKLLDFGLHSSLPSAQVLSLHSLLYLLAQPSDTLTPLLPLATEYIIKHLQDTSWKLNECHALMIWASAFFVAENYSGKQDLTGKILQASMNLCTDVVPLSLYLCIMHGLERLLLSDVLNSADTDLVLKLCVDRIKNGKPLESLPAIGVMLSALYFAKVPQHELMQGVVAEQHIAALERATLLFDRIKRGYPFEAQVISRIMPVFLWDFFPTQDILNKVIGEFLSNQQPHPQFLAGVLFKVCESLHASDSEELTQEWVLLSLSNFTQRSPLAMAIWSLTCCFVAATSSLWLRALFPLIEGRMGKFQDHDKQLFYISALDFFKQLENKEHQMQFCAVIEGVAVPDSPYAELLKRLPK